MLIAYIPFFSMPVLNDSLYIFLFHKLFFDKIAPFVNKLYNTPLVHN